MLSQANIYLSTTPKPKRLMRQYNIRQNTAQSTHQQPSFSKIDKSPKCFFFAIISLATVFVVSSIFYINTHVRVVELGYEITQALVKKQNLIEANKQLASQVAKLKSPQRLQETATGKLNLGRPEARQILRLSQLKQWTEKNPRIQVASLENNSLPKISTQPITKPMEVAKKVNISTIEKSTHSVKSTTQISQARPKNIILAQARTRSKGAQAEGPSFKQVPTALLDPMP